MSVTSSFHNSLEVLLDSTYNQNSCVSGQNFVGVFVYTQISPNYSTSRSWFFYQRAGWTVLRNNCPRPWRSTYCWTKTLNLPCSVPVWCSGWTSHWCLLFIFWQNILLHLVNHYLFLLWTCELIIVNLFCHEHCVYCTVVYQTHDKTPWRTLQWEGFQRSFAWYVLWILKAGCEN